MFLLRIRFFAVLSDFVVDFVFKLNVFLVGKGRHFNRNVWVFFFEFTIGCGATWDNDIVGQCETDKSGTLCTGAGAADTFERPQHIGRVDNLERFDLRSSVEVVDLVRRRISSIVLLRGIHIVIQMYFW